jgi:uncharacterized protein YqgQ
LIEVKKIDFEKLKKAGLIKEERYNKNYAVVNKKKKSSKKKYFVVEEKAILEFLGIK